MVHNRLRRACILPGCIVCVGRATLFRYRIFGEATLGLFPRQIQNLVSALPAVIKAELGRVRFTVVAPGELLQLVLIS